MELDAIKKPNILSLNEAAKFIGVSYVTMYRLVKNGKIESLNVAKTGSKPIFGFTPEMIQRYYDSLSNSPRVQIQEAKKREGWENVILKDHKDIDEQDLRGTSLGAEKID
jgi:excisionase family DNA binding protein